MAHNLRFPSQSNYLTCCKYGQKSSEAYPIATFHVDTILSISKE